jgi:predicted nucleotidyltransferase
LSRLDRASAPIIETNAERVAMDRAEAQLKPGFLGAIGDAINSEWSAAWAYRQYQGMGYEPDPDFRGVFADKALFDQFTDGLDNSTWSMLQDAVSLPHALKLRQQALSVQESRRRLASLGWQGAALTMAAGMLDPADIALGFATAGLGGSAVIGSRLTRMQRLARGGLVAAGSVGALEGYLATQDPQRDAGDVLLAGMGAFALGGALNTLVGSTRLHRAIEDAALETEHAEVVRAAMGAAGSREFTPEMKAIIAEDTLTENGRLKFKAQIDPKRQRQRAEQLIEHSGLDPVADADAIAELRAMDPEDILNRFTDADRLDNPYNAGTSPGIVGFTTSKGSTYTLSGTSTTRNKSLHPEHGAADVGLKPPSERTVYVDEEAALEAGSALALNPQSKPSVAIEGDELVVRYWSGKTKQPDGSWKPYAIEQVKRFPLAREPSIGSHPVEFWSGGKVHVGNDIVEIARESRSMPGTPPRNPSLRPATPDEIEARAGQILAERPDLTPEEAMDVARREIGVEDAAPRQPSHVSEQLTFDVPPGADEALVRHAATLREAASILTSESQNIANEIMRIYRKWGFDPGEVELHVVGGRTKGKPVSSDSDIDVVVKVEKPISPKSLDEMDARNAAQQEINEAVWKAAKNGNDVHVLEHASTQKPTGVRLGDGTAPPASPPRPPQRATDHPPINARVSEADLREARFGIIGRISPKAGLLNLAATLLAQDSLLRKAGGKFVASIDSASEWGRRTHRRTMNNYYREYLPQRNTWLRENGYTGLRKAEGERVFNRAVAFAVRSDEDFARASGQVKAAASVQRKYQAELLDLMKRHGVKGAARVDHSDNYLARIWLMPAVHRLIGQIGEDETFAFFKRAIVAANPDIDEDVAGRIGRGMVRTIRDLDKYSDLDKARLFSADSSDQIARILKEEAPELSGDQIAQIVYDLAGRKNQSNVPSRLKRRQMLDEGYEEMVQTRDGKLVQARISDLIDNDAERLFNTYARQAIGSSGEFSVYDAFARHIDPNPDTRPAIEGFDALKAAVAREMDEAGIDPKRRNIDLDKLETLWRNVRGMRQRGDMSPDGTTASVLRNMRALNYLRLAGSFGIAQIVELGNVVGEAGFKTMLRQMPAMGALMRRAQAGEWDNSLLGEIEAVWGIGTDHYISQIIERLDDATASPDQLTLGRFENKLQRLNRFQNRVSLMAGIDGFSRRLAAVSAIQRMADLAAGKKVSVKRLLELGLTDDQAKRVFSQINDHVETVQGQFGRRVKRLNLDAWTDQQAAAQFVTAVDKWANRVIQTNDVGATARWMNYDLGKTILQFRSFVVNAWEKQTLHKVQMRDLDAFNGAMATTMLASLVYMAQQYALSIGRADAEKFRQERLSPATIGRIGWSRGGWSSLLPQAIDNAWAFTGGDPMFQIGRYTGLKSAGLFQNPSTQLADNVLRTGPAIGRQIREMMGGDEARFTQTDARAFTSLIPFQNLLGIKNVLDSLVTRLPAKSNER